MEKVLLPVGTRGGWHKDLWEVLLGSGTVYPGFWIRVVGHNAPNYESDEEPT